MKNSRREHLKKVAKTKRNYRKPTAEEIDRLVDDLLDDPLDEIVKKVKRNG